SRVVDEVDDVTVPEARLAQEPVDEVADGTAEDQRERERPRAGRDAPRPEDDDDRDAHREEREHPREALAHRQGSTGVEDELPAEELREEPVGCCSRLEPRERKLLRRLIDPDDDERAEEDRPQQTAWASGCRSTLGRHGPG